jgi:FkbM family methyltransferase
METINLNLDGNCNLALNKPTFQSSFYRPDTYSYDPHGACNGKKNGRFGFSTCKENQPWWQIDLQGTYQLFELKVYNRIGFEERASTLNVLLSQDALNWELCYSNASDNLFGGIDGKPLTVNLQHKVARFVRLQLRDYEFLHLDEVEIYGIPFSGGVSGSQDNANEDSAEANFYRDLREELKLEQLFATQTGIELSSMKTSKVFNPKLSSIRVSDTLRLRKFVRFDQLNIDNIVGDITAISVESPGRFGNSIIQLSNAYHIANSIIQWGVNKIYLPNFWYIKPGMTNTLTGIQIINEEKPNFAPEKIVLEGMFFDYKPIAALALSKSKGGIPNPYQNMLNLDDALNLKHSDPLGKEELVIHIRSGDIFQKNPHLNYGQPPLSFYKKIVQFRTWHSISLVFEDKLNPIIEPLVAFCKQICASVREISGDLRSDIEYLLKARTLVVSRGSFSPAIATISKNLEIVYYFEGNFDPLGNPNVSCIKVIDKHGVYKSEILSGNWQNSESQRKLMLEYPMNALDFDSETNHQIKFGQTNMNKNILNPNLTVNLALNKPTAQSSAYRPEVYGYNPYGGCNGGKTGKFGFSTDKEDQPWWQIDLQAWYQLSKIRIYNRMDYCRERASTLNILLSQDALNWELCYSNPQDNIFGGIDGKPLIVDTQGKIARFVRLQLRENDYLHLDEIEIYGAPFSTDSLNSNFTQDEDTLSANFYSQAYNNKDFLHPFFSEPSKTFNHIEYKGQLLQDKWVVMMTQGKQKGFFLEIGSTDGVELNNTFCLEKNFSWSGICVEPNPDYYKKLCMNRTAITLPYALYKKSGEIVEFVHHGVLGTISEFSSEDFHALERKQFVSEKGTIKVITASPEDVFNLYKVPEKFDFLSLDVEGAELEILRAFDLSKWLPALACIEHNFVADKRLAIFELLSSYGYQRIQSQFDDWYYNLDVLQVLNPEIPLSYYQEVVEYFRICHGCKLVDEISLDSNKLVKKVNNSNLALNKPTAQSSIYQPEVYNYDPHGACNGRKTGKFGFSTDKEDQPWWQIDLQAWYQLSEMKIYNRMDCCKERASTLNILLSQDALNWELCYSNPQENIFGGIDGKPLIVDIQGKVVRFVRLQLRENEYLHLDEVEIYGIPIGYGQDEGTLSANFYAKASLPPLLPPTQLALTLAKGIVHVGAHKGEEAEFYATQNKSVIWIEALPQVFEVLEKKVAKYPNQKAINALVTDIDGKEYKFNISNNSVSSSLFEFGNTKDDLYPQLKMVDSVSLVGKTLSNIYHEFEIDESKFDLLLLDVQGAELMVLKGAESVLHNFNYVLTEVSTVEIYKNGVLWDELKTFLNNKGFKEAIFGNPRKHGDVLFVRDDNFDNFNLALNRLNF